MLEGGGMLGLNPGLRDHPLHNMMNPFPGLAMGHGGGASMSLQPPQPNMWPFIWSHITNLLPQLSIARMDPLSQVFSLKWNHHRTNMINVLERLLNTEAFCDVTIACEGGSIKCHKIVLSASSSYFEKLFLDNTCEHPIVFLKDVKEHQMRAIIEYMYRGDVSISQEELPALLRVAELLKVKGMMEERRDCKDLSRPRTSSPEATPPSSTPTTSPRAERLPSLTSTMPPTSIISTAPLPNFRPFLTPPGQGSSSPFPMWPIPGMFHGHHNNIFSTRDDIKPISPGPKERSKVSSGSASLDKDIPLPPLVLREGLEDKPGYERQSDPDDRLYDKSPKSAGMYGGGQVKMEGVIAGYVPAQRLEWKRYKQYTRSDIVSAIEEVKTGKSALQVSKKYNIPSRTLYDKVKKMGITTGRQQQRKSMGGNFNSYSAAFPGMNTMVSPLSRLNGISIDNPYRELIDRMKEARDEEDRDSREAEGGTGGQHPPFNILSPHMLNMNMMDRMRGEERESSSPMNLSSEREDKNRQEGSIPQSPSPSSAELTSPSNPHTSPGEYSRNHSPPPIDIRAQFLAGLRRLGDRPSSPIEADMRTQSFSAAPKDSLPPRKRKVSAEMENGGKMANVSEHSNSLEHGLNGLHDGDREIAQVN